MSNTSISRLSFFAVTLTVPACANDNVPLAEAAHEAALDAPEEQELLPRAITEDELDAYGEVIPEALPCGLSVLEVDYETEYWIQNCRMSTMGGSVISLYKEHEELGAPVDVKASSLVSGTVRGRVLRFRRM